MDERYQRLLQECAVLKKSLLLERAEVKKLKLQLEGNGIAVGVGSSSDVESTKSAESLGPPSPGAAASEEAQHVHAAVGYRPVINAIIDSISLQRLPPSEAIPLATVTEVFRLISTALRRYAKAYGFTVGNGTASATSLVEVRQLRKAVDELLKDVLPPLHGNALATARAGQARAAVKAANEGVLGYLGKIGEALGAVERILVAENTGGAGSEYMGTKVAPNVFRLAFYLRAVYGLEALALDQREVVFSKVKLTRKAAVEALLPICKDPVLETMLPIDCMPQDSTLSSLLDVIFTLDDQEIRRIEQREQNALQSDMLQEALEQSNKDLMLALKQAEVRGESLREAEAQIRALEQSHAAAMQVASQAAGATIRGLEGKVKEAEAREMAREKAVAEQAASERAEAARRVGAIESEANKRVMDVETKASERIRAIETQAEEKVRSVEAEAEKRVQAAEASAAKSLPKGMAKLGGVQIYDPLQTEEVELDDDTRAAMQALVLATYQPEALLGRLQYAESSVVRLQRQLNEVRQR